MKETDPKIIDGGIACDDRGNLRFINDASFKKVKRFYQVQNHEGVIRAFHGHLKEGKYVYVPTGSAKIILLKMDEKGFLDLEKEMHIYILDSRNPRMLWIPPGYANGMKSLEPHTNILFFSTTTLEEAKNDDYRFRWDVINPNIWNSTKG